MKEDSLESQCSIISNFKRQNNKNDNRNERSLKNSFIETFRNERKGLNLLKYDSLESQWVLSVVRLRTEQQNTSRKLFSNEPSAIGFGRSQPGFRAAIIGAERRVGFKQWGLRVGLGGLDERGPKRRLEEGGRGRCWEG